MCDVCHSSIPTLHGPLASSLHHPRWKCCPSLVTNPIVQNGNWKIIQIPPFLCSSLLHLVTTESITAPSCNLDVIILHIEKRHCWTLVNLNTKNSLSSLFPSPLFSFVGDNHILQWSWFNHLILKEYAQCFVVMSKKTTFTIDKYRWVSLCRARKMAV